MGAMPPHHMYFFARRQKDGTYMDSFTKAPKHKDQVEIELEKLVPFGHKPFEWFQGQRLVEMITEISECDPIDIVD